MYPRSRGFRFTCERYPFAVRHTCIYKDHTENGRKVNKYNEVDFRLREGEVGKMRIVLNLEPFRSVDPKWHTHWFLPDWSVSHAKSKCVRVHPDSKLRVFALHECLIQLEWWFSSTLQGDQS